jgi:hypothetical protein
MHDRKLVRPSATTIALLIAPASKNMFVFSAASRTVLFTSLATSRPLMVLPLPPPPAGPRKTC